VPPGRSFRFNEVQRQIAGIVYSRAFDGPFLQRADIRELGESWAAAASYPRDRRAQVAQERIEDRLQQLQPAAMTVYRHLVSGEMPSREAMLRAVPLMEPGRAPLSPGELPTVTAVTRLGHVATPSPVDVVPADPYGDEHIRRRLVDLSEYLQRVTTSGPRDPNWRGPAELECWTVGEVIKRVGPAIRVGLDAAPVGSAREAGPDVSAAALANESHPASAADEVARARATRTTGSSSTTVPTQGPAPRPGTDPNAPPAIRGRT